MKKINEKTKFNKVNVSITHGQEKSLKSNSVKEYSKNDKLSRYQKKIDRRDRIIKGTSYIGEHGGNFFAILMLILIGVAMIRILYYGSADTISIGSLLDMLRDVPNVSANVKNFVQSQVLFPEQWVGIDGLRVFLNSLVSVFSIVIWLASSLIDVVLFLVYFLGWLFI